MGRGKKQFRVVGDIGIDQNELMDMVKQLSGDPSELDPEIVKDKYNRLRNDIIRCTKLVRKFKVAILDNLHTKRGVDVGFDHEVANLVRFADSVDEYMDVEATDDNRTYVYQALKDSFVVEEYLKVCKKLQDNASCIKDRCALSDTFIVRAVCDEFFLFDFARINFQHLFDHILAENFPEEDELSGCKQYILVMCNMLYITTQDIYTIVSSPDVDIDKLSEMIITAIAAAKKQVPRCDKAFRIIESSVDMLKNGMNTYYKDFVATGNVTIIFDNFLRDIGTDLHLDAQTMGQFKRIIFHFRKQANSMPQKAAQLSGVFSTLDKIMNIMDGQDDKDKTEA